MSLLAPLGLLGLIALPVIAALWMLKLRRPERDISSTFLWQHLVRDVEANAPWQRLRRSLLLLLQLLCALLLVAVVVRPALERPAGLAHDLVLVVDASASMSATDVPLDRLDAARRAAIEALRELPAGGRVSVIAAGDTARVVANEVTDVSHATRAIEGIEPSVGTGDMEAALRLADALAARATGSQILVVSDASGPVPPDLHLAAPVDVLTVGRERDNQAIAALAVRADPGGLRRQVFVSIANESAAVVPRRLELLADGTVFTARDLALDGLTRHDVVIDELPPEARVVEARLTTAADAQGMAPMDHLALDDRAWAIVPDQRVRNVLLIGDGSLFLRNALALLPWVELYGVTEQEWESGTARDGAWDLVVLEGVVPDPLPQAPILAFAPPTGSPLGEVTGSVATPAVGTPSPDEPLLRDVDLSRFHVGRAQRLTTPPWARVVLPGSADTPLIYSGSRDGQPTTVFAFALEDSDLPLQVAWPILLGNVTADLLGRDAPTATPLRPGAVVELPLPQGITGVRVTLPDGSVREAVPSASGSSVATFVDTWQLGVYRADPITADGSAPVAPSTWFAVDLFEPGEASILPSDGSALAALGGSPGTTATAGTARDEWWVPLVLLLLVVLAAEWLLYERDGARRIAQGVRSRLRRAAPGRAASR
jgi:hypothetical protein